MAPMVEERGHRFPGAAPGEPGSRPARPARDERALEQTLEVEDEIVGRGGQALAGAPTLLAKGCGEPGPPPAPDRHRDHVRHARMKARKIREGFLDHPVDDRVRTRGADV